MKKIALFYLVLIASMTSYAYAEGPGLFLEPGVSYQYTKGDINYPAPFTNANNKVRGLGVLTRAGLHVASILFVGADGRYAWPRVKDPNNNLNSTANSWDVAPVIGLQMPTIGLRIWGEYVIAGNLDPRDTNGVNLKFEDPTGWRAGAGFRIYNISLNLEYQRVRYDTITNQRIGTFSATSFQNNSFTNEGFIGSVSFPIEF